MVNERIRALRKALGLTQEEVGTITGMRRTDVVRLESGALKATTRDTLRALSIAFGVTLDAMDAYLEGQMDLDVVVLRSSRPDKRQVA